MKMILYALCVTSLMLGAQDQAQRAYFTGTASLNKVRPCGQYAPFLSQVVGYTVEPTQECAELTLTVREDELLEFDEMFNLAFSSPGFVHTSGTGPYKLHALLKKENPLTSIMPVSELNNDNNGVLPPKNFPLQPRFCSNAMYITLQAACVGRNDLTFGEILKIAQTVNRMDEDALRSYIRNHKIVDTPHTAYVTSWKRFCLSSASWLELLKRAVQEQHEHRAATYRANA